MEPTFEFAFDDDPLASEGPLIADPHAEISAAIEHLSAAVELLVRRAVEDAVAARR